MLPAVLLVLIPALTAVTVVVVARTLDRAVARAELAVLTAQLHAFERSMHALVDGVAKSLPHMRAFAGRIEEINRVLRSGR